MFKVFKNIYNLVNFDKLSYKQLATLPLVKKLLIQPLYKHNRKTQINLYQGKRHHSAVQTCFSQKKSLRDVRVNTFKKRFYSDILDRKIKVTVSSTAFKTIKKYGGFDNYILCMDPKKLDSNYGNYLKTLMLRKMQNPHMIVPYIFRTKPYTKLRAKQYHYNKLFAKTIQKPSLKLGRYDTDMKPFGYEVDQVDQKRYKKYKEAERIISQQQDGQISHPLIKQLQKQLELPDDPQFEKQANEARQQYMSQKKYKKVIKKKFEKDERDFYDLQKTVELDFNTSNNKF